MFGRTKETNKYKARNIVVVCILHKKPPPTTTTAIYHRQQKSQTTATFRLGSQHMTTRRLLPSADRPLRYVCLSILTGQESDVSL